MNDITLDDIVDELERRMHDRAANITALKNENALLRNYLRDAMTFVDRHTAADYDLWREALRLADLRECRYVA